MTTTPPSTQDTLRDHIALALAEHDGEDTLAAYRAGAAQDYWLGQADVALTVVQPVLAEQTAELERLHHAWTRHHDQLTHTRAERDYAFALLPAEPPPPARTAWERADPEPGPEVTLVRGRRTRRLFTRHVTPAGLTRWVHTGSAWWSRWPYLVIHEGGVELAHGVR